MHLIHKLQNLTMNAQIQGWEEFGKNSRKGTQEFGENNCFQSDHQEQFSARMETNLQRCK